MIIELNEKEVQRLIDEYLYYRGDDSYFYNHANYLIGALPKRMFKNK